MLWNTCVDLSLFNIVTCVRILINISSSAMQQNNIKLYSEILKRVCAYWAAVCRKPFIFLLGVSNQVVHKIDKIVYA